MDRVCKVVVVVLFFRGRRLKSVFWMVVRVRFIEEMKMILVGMRINIFFFNYCMNINDGKRYCMFLFIKGIRFFL